MIGGANNPGTLYGSSGNSGQNTSSVFGNQNSIFSNQNSIFGNPNPSFGNPNSTFGNKNTGFGSTSNQAQFAFPSTPEPFSGLFQNTTASNSAGCSSVFGNVTPPRPQLNTSSFGCSENLPINNSMRSNVFGNPRDITSSALNSTNVFGASVNPLSGTQSSSSLFGTPANSAVGAQPSLSLLGSSTAPSNGGSTPLFGTQKAQNTTGTACLFGSQPAQSNPGSTSLFGAQTGQSATTTVPLFGAQTGQSATTAAPLFGCQASQNTAGSTSLFGGPTPQANSGSSLLFGGQTTQNTTGSASLFGSQPAQSNPGSTSLFGGQTGQSATTTAPLFGCQVSQNTAGSTSPFGGPTPQANSGSSFLFGGQTNQNAPSTAFLFGGQPSKNATGLGSLFGGQTSQNATGSASLFGSQTAQNTPVTTSLFGSQLAQSPTKATSVFGTQPSQNTAGTGSLFGSQTAQITTGSAPVSGAQAGSSSAFSTFSFGGSTATTSPATTSCFGGQPMKSSGETPLFGAGAQASGDKSKPFTSGSNALPEIPSAFALPKDKTQPASSIFDGTLGTGTGGLSAGLSKNLGATGAFTTTPGASDTSTGGTEPPNQIAKTKPFGDKSSTLNNDPSTCSLSLKIPPVPSKASTGLRNIEPSTQLSSVLSTAASSSSIGERSGFGFGTKQDLTKQDSITKPFGGQPKQALDTTSALKSLTSQEGKTQLDGGSSGFAAKINLTPDQKKGESGLTLKTSGLQSLENSQYDRIDELLQSWDARTRKQIAVFSKYAESVASLDLDLCNSVLLLEKLQKAQQHVDRRQCDVDVFLRQIEQQQSVLSDTLEEIQSILESYLTNDVLTHPVQVRAQKLYASLDHSESFLEDLVEKFNDMQDTLNPSSLSDVLTTVNIQQELLLQLENEAKILSDKISLIGKKL